MNNTSYAISPERAARFEKGDTRLLTHWKSRVSSSGIPYYAGIYALEMNKGGMRSPEMYYIKAECLARKGGEANIREAMELVNKVRKHVFFLSFIKIGLLQQRKKQWKNNKR